MLKSLTAAAILAAVLSLAPVGADRAEAMGPLGSAVAKPEQPITQVWHRRWHRVIVVRRCVWRRGIRWC